MKGVILRLSFQRADVLTTAARYSQLYFSKPSLPVKHRTPAKWRNINPSAEAVIQRIKMKNRIILYPQ